MATTCWRLAGFAEGLDLDLDSTAWSDLRVGEVKLALVPTGSGSLVVADVEVETPDPIREWFSAHSSRFETLASRADAPLRRAPVWSTLRRLEELEAGRIRPPGHESVPRSSARVLSPGEVEWLLPNAEVLSFAADQMGRLRYAAHRIVQLVRWVGNLSMASLPLVQEVFLCSLDGVHWADAPEPGEVADVPGEVEIGLGPAAEDLFARLLAEEHLAEPVFHQIFREAVALCELNPRASFVLALSSVEVGIKMLAASRSSSRSEPWLALEVPAPPLDRLIKEYLPLITSRHTRMASDEAVPKRLREALVEGAKTRNKLLHQGTPEPSLEELSSILASVNDFLYLLDWFAGREWAFRNLSAELQREYQ